MKKLTTIISAIALGIALFQPISAFADDHDQKGNGKGKKEKGKEDNREQVVQQSRVSAPVARSRRDTVLSPNVNARPSNAERSRSRSVQNQTVYAPSSRYSGSTLRASQSSGYSGRGNNTYYNQNTYTRSNNYGGLWIQGDNHRDWNRSGVHEWNHHRYGWYDGGWLIIDGGYQPRGYSYSNYSNYSGGSMTRQVQRRLSEKGYRLGYADGVIGPATRSAIAEYQQDNGLAATGRINNSLLSSLGLL